MSKISSSGSTIDVATIVSQLMAIEKAPLNKLNTAISATNAKISAYSTIKSKLSTLQKATRSLQGTFDVAKNSLKATSSNPNILEATVTGTTAVTSRQISVTALAKRHRIASADFADASSPLGMTSSIKVEVGEWSGSSFKAGASAKSKTIDLTGKSLKDVADEINGAGVGVSARIEGSAGAMHLVVESSVEGTASGIQISHDSGPDSETALLYDRASGGMTEKVAAKNAVLTVDGDQVVSQTNTVTSVPGLTITLKSEISGAVTLTTAADPSALKAKLDAFVAAYNDVASFIKIKAPSGTDTTGDLKNDQTAPSIIRSLRSAITASSGASSMGTLNAMGIRFDATGTLAIDSADFDRAVTTKYDAVVGLLAGTHGTGSGIMASITAKVGDLLAAKGAVGVRNDGLSRLLTSQKAQRTKLESRLPKLEAKYNQQYSTLDANLTAMSQKLASVMAGLNIKTSTA